MRCFLIFGFLAGALTSALAGCQWKASERNSILIVAVDRLGVTRAGCGTEKDDATRSGLAALCDESVRFSHAFTTSTLSAPAMGSILTGRYPFRSGLRHNGGGELGTLSSSIETAPERALQLGYRTFFVASAPPLLRRTGLHQGFEIFDDAIHPDSRRLHRSAREVVDIFSSWIGKLGDREPFFAVVHMSDLLVPWQPTHDDSGRARESTVSGQLEEIDESLGRLWDFLKSQNRWSNTTVVLVGLQGDSIDIRAGEIPALDLHSETTHVSLLIKEASRSKQPATTPRETRQRASGQPAYEWVPKTWSFDVNVSLADLGVTLFDWLEAGDESNVQFDEARSLRSALRGPGESIEEWRQDERWIASESAWARWQVRESIPIRVALRRGPFLYIHDAIPTIYNTLTDAFEVAPMPQRNDRTRELRSGFDSLATELGFRPFPGVSAADQLEEKWARNYFSQRLGARSTPNTKADDQRIEILSTTSLKARTWIELRRWESGGALGPEPTACSRLVFSVDSGLGFTSSTEAEIARLCPFRSAKEIARWYRSKNPEERDRLFESIYRVDQQRIAAVRVAETSLALGQIWETGSTRRLSLEGIESLMWQPEAQKLRQQITRRSRSLPEL